MKLYIANTTKQRHDFAYRQPETGRLIYHPINAGAQSVVLDGTGEIDLVIQQHGVYGLIDATKSTRTAFISACATASTSRCSRASSKAMRDNDDHLNRAAHERRQASVIATNNALSEQESGYRGELGERRTANERQRGQGRNPIR